MNLYVGNSKKYYRYELPEKIDGSFLFTYKTINNVEVFFNVQSNNDSWQLQNDNQFNIVGHENSTSMWLSLPNYIQYHLFLKSQNEEIFIFTTPSLETNEFILSAPNSFSIGSHDANIIYIGNNEIDYKVTINKNNNVWYIDCSNSPIFIYVNGERINKKNLMIGDVIFINGIKIIWMNTFFKISNVQNKLQITNGFNQYNGNLIQDNSIYDNISDDDKSLDLYKEDEYFFHSPRLKSVVEQKEVEIDSPTPCETRDEIPFILQIGSSLTMLAFSGVTFYDAYNTYQETGEISSVITQLVMAIAMLVGSLVFPILLQQYNRKLVKKREVLRQTRYTEYLNEKQKELSSLLLNENEILKQNFPHVDECVKIVNNRKSSLWSREIADEDFLKVRVGSGNIPADLTIIAPEKHFALYDDNLFDNACKIANDTKILKNAPVTVSFLENYISAIVTNANFYNDYLNGILLQLITFHSGKDLKIVMLTNKTNEANWSYLKVLPHLWSDDKEMRFFASDLNDAKKIVSYLEKDFQKRIEVIDEENKLKEKNNSDKKPYLKYSPYYLIITDNYKEIKQLNFINELLNTNKNIGFSLLMFEKSIQNLPNECNTFTYVLDKTSCIFHKELTSNQQQNFLPEYNPTIDMDLISSHLASIPIEENGGVSMLPTSISFLEMLNVGRIEQLNILNKWKTSNPITSLSAPIGVHASGDLFYLDLHEKAHGPHGLIAGSTGSGKSEFIITYILSMAVHYHPYEVQFVLIDYKGGGLAGAFENRELGIRIPHLAGTITNLDISEMNRTLVSINSELKRRQRVFNEVRDQLGESTIDIYKYQKLFREGVVKDPIPHLFIISDEFAELKSQQPDFMDELISAARIGRSLGVHLILATQKPSGVVNDQIWSNSKFKVCLKVQTKSDSMEMLKRDEAASIKETGRFYLQVGYNELFEQGQSAWCGAKYIPTDKVKKKIDDSINFVNNIGEQIISINDVVKKDTSQDYGEQLTNIVKYLVDLANKNNIVTKKLWLESLPEEIFVSNLQKKYNYKPEKYNANVIIGEYDNPKNQLQGLVTLDLKNGGNVLLIGAPGSGKENFLTTLITSAAITHSPEEINFYILDFGAETMKKFNKFPHVGDIIYSSDEEKLENFFNFLNDEMKKRKELFSDYSGDYNSFIEESENKLPEIVVLINSYEIMIENYPNSEDLFSILFRDGVKYGIVFVVTTSMSNAVRFRMMQLFNNKLCLQLNDDSDYSYIMDAPKELKPAKKFGRGLISKDDQVYEFQTALVSKRNDINSVIKNLGLQLQEVYNISAPNIPTLPRVVLWDKLLDDNININNIPIGVKKSNFKTKYYNFNENHITPVIASDLEHEINFLFGLAKIYASIPKVKVRVIDFAGNFKTDDDKISIYNKDFDTVIQQVYLELEKDNNTDKFTVFIFNGIGSINKRISADVQEFIDEVFMQIKNCNNNLFIIADSYIMYREIETERWYSNVDNSNGIWLGNEIGSQNSIKVNNIELDERREEFNYMAFAISKGKHTLIRYVVDKERDDSEE